MKKQIIIFKNLIKMKKTYSLVLFTIIAISSIAFISCNDEEEFRNNKTEPTQVNNLPQLDTKELMSIENQNSRTIWMSIILAKNFNKTITLSPNSNGLLEKVSNKTKNKPNEKPDFWSCDSTEFHQWALEKVKEGYTVTITYDDELGCYFGWAYIEEKKEK